MAIAYEAAGVGENKDFGAASSGALAAFEHPGADGPNGVVIVPVLGRREANARMTLSVTYGGLPMQSVGPIVMGGGYDQNAFAASFFQWFVMVNPPAGAQPVVVRWSANKVCSPRIAANSLSYTGVASFNPAPFTETGTEAGTALSLVVPSATGRVIVQAFAHEPLSGDNIASYNKTARFSLDSSLYAQGLVGEAAGAATVTFTAVRSTGADYLETALDLLPYVGGSGPGGSDPDAAVSGGAGERLRDIEKACGAHWQQHELLRRSFPLIRLWMNDPNEDAGAVMIGRVDFTDSIKGSFPFKNNTPTQGILQLRDDHYIAQFLKQLPVNEELHKNVLITVDFYGGAKRWSGLLDKWNVKTSEEGSKYFEMSFQDDLTFLQYLLCPPNPLLPIPVFQFPRIFALAGPAKWAVSMIILLNLLRVEGNWWTLPDDPFDLDSWLDPFQPEEWQAYVKCSPFALDDSSLWTFLASRMNPIDSVIADSLEDAQLTIQYRRILTDDGESLDIQGYPNCKNGALRFEVVDNSNAHVFEEGTFLSGTAVEGFIRSVVVYGGGFIEDTFSSVQEDSSYQPDEYYSPGWMQTVAKTPWLVVRDNEWTPITSSDLSWGPSKNVSVVVGGDNPAADAIAKLIIETVGNIVSYFLLLGFSSGGTIAADIIMPFLVGTIAAWLHWKNTGRATSLGWIHYWELYQAGAENNSWSMAAMNALRGGFLAGKSESTHIMEFHEFWAIPGVHFDVGHRIGSGVDSPGIPDIIWVNQVEEMIPEWDHSGDGKPYSWVIKAGKSDRNMGMGERMARLSKKFLEATNNIGVHLVQS